MAHDHSHHHFVVADEDNERRLFRALALTGSFMLVEIAGGLWTNSLALLADAGHMFGDFVSLAFGWVAFRIGAKSPDLRRSFGYHRFQVLAAFVNGATLFVIAVAIGTLAVTRFFSPPTVLAGPMLAVAIIGVFVNLFVYRILSAGDNQNLNVRGAAAHVLADLLGSFAAIIASVTILTTGWMQADVVLSLLATVLILRTAYRIVVQSGHILLEGTPDEVDPSQVEKQLTNDIPAVLDVHHVHIWSLTDERPVLTLHARVAETADHDETLSEIHRALAQSFGVSHATVQIEYGPCPDTQKHT